MILEEHYSRLIKFYKLENQIEKRKHKSGYILVTLGDRINNKKQISGVLDDKGRIVIPFKYERILFLDIRDKITVKEDKVWKIIDITGREYLSLFYDEVGAYSEGFIAVKKKKKWGYVDLRGKETIPCIYDDAFPFREGVAGVGYILILVKRMFDRSPDEKLCSYGFIDSSGKEVIPLVYAEVKSFNNSIAKVKKQGKSLYANRQWGYIDKKGLTVIPFLEENEEFHKKWGWVNKAGHIQVSFSKSYEFSEGLIESRENNSWVYLDQTGKVVLSYNYEESTPFKEGIARVKRNGKWGCIDRNEKEIIPFIYDEIHTFNNGIAIISVKGKYGYINRTGKVLIPCIYDKANPFIDGVAKVMNNNKWGIINIFGFELTLFIYDDITPFCENLASYKRNNKWGVLNRSGTEITPPKYAHIGVFKNGFARVADEPFSWRNGKWGILNKNGIEIITPIYTSIMPSDNKENSEYYVEDNGKYGLFYLNKLVIPLVYTSQLEVFKVWSLQEKTILKDLEKEANEISNDDVMYNISSTSEGNLLATINIMTGLIYEKEEEIDWYVFINKCKEINKKHYLSLIETLRKDNLSIDKYLEKFEDGVYVEEKRMLKRWLSNPSLFSSTFLERYQHYLIWDRIWSNYDCSEWFIRKFIDKVWWKAISWHQRLSEKFIEDYYNKVDWSIVSFNQYLSTELIKKNQDKVDWKAISRYQDLTEEFIETFKSKLDWSLVQRHQKLSESFIEKFESELNWDLISSYQNLSEEFIEKFYDKVNWSNILKWQMLSNDFVEKHIEKSTYYGIMFNKLDSPFLSKYNYNPSNKSWLYLDRTVKKEKLQRHFRHFECYDDFFYAFKEIRLDRYDINTFRYRFYPNQTYESKASPIENESEYYVGFEVTAQNFIRNNRHKLTGNNMFSKCVKCKIYYDDVTQIVENSGFNQTFVKCSRITFLE